LADENRLWGAPRIHGELLKLGIVVSERTVSRYLRECPRRPSQTWRTFLANQLGQFTCISSVISPDPSRDDVVDATAVTCRSTPVSERLSASSQCVLVDWRASVRTAVGSRISQDHFRGFTGLRRSTSRAPPKNVCVQPSSGVRAAGRFVPLASGRLRRSTARDRCGSLIRDRDDRHREAGRLGLVGGRHAGVVISRTVGIVANHSLLMRPTVTCSGPRPNDRRIADKSAAAYDPFS
jgi:hypothetical protein